MSPNVSPGANNQTAPEIRLMTMAALGSFSWRWPEGLEFFQRGWTAVAAVADEEVRIRHGIGRRFAYGRERAHSVTWVEGEPTVEGVEADDFETSDSLLSLIKMTKSHIKPDDALPTAYRSFSIVVMASEVSGRYSPTSLAVKLRQDDVDGWTRHALLRAHFWGRLGRRTRERSSLPTTSHLGPAPAAVQTSDTLELPAAVAAALLAYGATQKPTPQGPILDFTSNEAANELLRTDGFAFLTAVLFDQRHTG